MKPGGGKAKGSAFERDTAKRLSLWVSGGARADLFARTVLSGGQATAAAKRGEEAYGWAGDLMANHPDAFRFARRFTIECKHVRDIGLEAFLFDPRGERSFLGRVFAKTAKDAAKIAAEPVVIAKQNLRPTVILLAGDAARALLRAKPLRLSLRHHSLHDGRYLLAEFDATRQVVCPVRWMDALDAIRSPSEAVLA